MNLLVNAAAILLLAEPTTIPTLSRDSMSAVVARIQKADYEGDRKALANLRAELAPYTESERFASRARYWRGFALWRRALNGFNDNADPQELEKDLTEALEEFRQALAKDPDFVDAKVGAASCLGNLAFLTMKDPVRRPAYFSEYLRLLGEVRKEGPENPRMLWVSGVAIWYTPPERGGSQAKAFETYERGLALARSQKGATTDPLEPSWGEPELLMNLAFANLNRSEPDLAAADRYASEALKLVPNWHYVRDILKPQIRDARAKQKPS
jgi:tetratricopeptide (TPR) repeat protein